MKMPPIVSPQEWETAREELLVKEKELTRARDALAAQRRRMPWMAVEKDYCFEGPNGPAEPARPVRGAPAARRIPLLLRAGGHHLRARADPTRSGPAWGVRSGADQVAHPAHLNARDTTLAFASRAPQADIQRFKERMGWQLIPWYTITDDFDADFDVDEWHGTNAFIRDGDQHLPHLLHRQPRRRGDGQHLELPRHDRTRPPGGLGGLTARATRRRRRTGGGTTTTPTGTRRDRPYRGAAAGGAAARPDRRRQRAAGGARVDRAPCATPPGRLNHNVPRDVTVRAGAFHHDTGGSHAPTPDHDPRGPEGRRHASGRAMTGHTTGTAGWLAASPARSVPRREGAHATRA